MLRHRDQSRIRAEEIFRAEVRASLEPQRTLLGRLNKFLATPLGTILVSTVISGCISWTYNEVKIDMDMERKNFDLTARLDSEISWRIQQFIVAFRTFEKKEGALENFERPQHIFYLFDDYKDRPTSSLLRELHDLVRVEESDAIKFAYNSVIYVRYTRLKNQGNGTTRAARCTEKNEGGKRKLTECVQDGADDISDKRRIVSAGNLYSVAAIGGSEYMASGANRNCLEGIKNNTKDVARQESEYRSVCHEIFKAFNQERWNHPFDADYANLASYSLIKAKPNNPHEGVWSHLKYRWRQNFK